MAIVVGQDSYVTVAEANEYIGLQYHSGDARRAAWEAMAEADREACLRRAAREMESLPYRGAKLCFSQTLAFPRADGAGARYGEEGACGQTAGEIPQDIRNAQIEEALELAAPGPDSQTRERLRGAVLAYSVGHFSETYSGKETDPVRLALASTAAQRMAARYVGGGYRVR